MDKTDMALIMLLSANSRQSYTALAKKLGLSVNAVHKRIQLLLESGVIKKFTAKISIMASKAVVVFISGTSTLPSLHDLPQRIKTQGSIYWLAVGGGQYLYLGAYLKTINDLPPLTDFIKREAGIPQPTIGIMSYAPYPLPPIAFEEPQPLTTLDYRIITSLKDDARKPLADVATEIHVSTKTVRRRLARMIQYNLIELGLEWYPDKSNDIITLIDLHLRPNVDLSTILKLQAKYAPNLLFFWTFVNVPNAVTFTAWTNSMNDLQTLRNHLEKEDGVDAVEPNILYTGYIFETWRDHLPTK